MAAGRAHAPPNLLYPKYVRRRRHLCALTHLFPSPHLRRSLYRCTPHGVGCWHAAMLPVGVCAQAMSSLFANTQMDPARGARGAIRAIARYVALLCADGNPHRCAHAARVRIVRNDAVIAILVAIACSVIGIPIGGALRGGITKVLW
jgi:hypothetical protein